MSTPELQPMPRRRLTEPERWAVYLDGRRIGEVHEKRHGRGPVFFKAFAVDPGTGILVNLDLNTDRDERVTAVVSYAEGRWVEYQQARLEAGFQNPFPSGSHTTPNISGLGGWHDNVTPAPDVE